MQDSAEVDRAHSQADRAYLALEEAIVTLRLAPAALVTEAQLVEVAQLGRTPVREAVLRLAQQGLVGVLPRRGLQIAPLDAVELLGVLDVRQALERLCAVQAAFRGSPAERRAVLDVALQMEAAAVRGDEIAYLRLDKAEDEAMGRAVRNPYAVRALEPLQALMRRAWYAFDRERDLKPAAGLHLAVARAVAIGEPETAGAAADALMAHFRAGLQRQIVGLDAV